MEQELLKQILDGINQLVEQQKKEPSLLLSKSKAAHLLDCSEKTIDRLTKEGVLKSHRLKGRVLYKRSEIIEAVNNLTD